MKLYKIVIGYDTGSLKSMTYMVPAESCVKALERIQKEDDYARQHMIIKEISVQRNAGRNSPRQTYRQGVTRFSDN